ncbi:hypothetical protein PMAA_061270 [Talaromyces marneffei ATCC 18224]|uniref:Uncharacterized protein n=1 Tax=Talaromyces marneffei (strain ATCC 18224 / CBS 334.59 / QM 7333) TaxID=441960 RepID=B6QMY0_TALMQ|nr:hypothetical protein PMAA_061270 [Talaromyces marneffei ATCC 18224]
MGDANVEWTGGVLRSNMHRINYAPGDQRYTDRYSVAMAVRPFMEASMGRLQGGRIPTAEDDRCEGIEIAIDNANTIGSLTAQEWELKKAMSLRDGLHPKLDTDISSLPPTFPAREYTSEIFLQAPTL